MADPNRSGRARVRVRGLVASAVALLLAAGAVACGSDGENAANEQLNGMTRNPPLEVGSVSLPDEGPGGGGRPVRLAGERGGLMLVYFGYTSCPDVCPATLADVHGALSGLERSDAKRVRVGMVTVDPKRDTPRVLNGYLGHFFPRDRFNSFRTTDQRRLARVEAAFGASSKLGKPDREGNYEVAHTAQVFAVDAGGTVLVEWPFGTTSENIRSDLERLLSGAGPERS